MKTYNTIVKSKEVKTLENVVARAPYECVKLDENKYGFMDNANGDIRNYFCDTLGYECSNYEAAVPEGLEIVAYSEKAIAVFGNTKAIKDELKKLGGKFNPALKHNGEKRAGWVFSKKQADKVRALLAPASDPSESVTLPEPPKEIDITDVLEEMNTKQESERNSFAKASKEFIREWRANNPYPGPDYLDEFNAKFNREYSDFVEKWAKDNGTQINSYMLPNPYPIERGEYQETELDRQKKQADILLESIDGNWYTIRLNKGIKLKSKRIRNYDNGCIAVPESVYTKLQGKYNVMCNF